MYIQSVHLKGFRNFRDAEIQFNQQTLVIGYNDVGKSNLAFALRLLLDNTLPEAALEPKDSDFYVHEQTDEISVSLHLADVNEECLRARLREHVSDTGESYLVYEAKRDPNTRKKTYRVLAGFDLQHLVELPGRTSYLRVLNLRFIESRRNLLSYLRRERRELLGDAKQRRKPEEAEQDSEILLEIQQNLTQVTSAVKRLHYVESATEALNKELAKLSYRNETHEIGFDTGATDPAEFVDNLELVGRVAGRSLGVGGDGRNNQIHLALWASRNNIAYRDGDEPEEVSIFCIEEPEAHLHPHQQRKLADYLVRSLSAQVIITSHSPQIAAEFPPRSIVRLRDSGSGTVAASGGCSDLIEARSVEFGYRLNILPAEAFFSSAILLVEGPSEELFYRALAESIGIDLDRLNISILMVSGVGFEPYASLLHALEIPFAVRTDLDRSRVPRTEMYRYSGIERAIHLYRLYYGVADSGVVPEELVRTIQRFPARANKKVEKAAKDLVGILAQFGLFLSKRDLEHDLFDELPAPLKRFVGETDPASVIAAMQAQKATFMFRFLLEHTVDLAELAQGDLALPLHYCVRLVENAP